MARFNFDSIRTHTIAQEISFPPFDHFNGLDSVTNFSYPTLPVFHFYKTQLLNKKSRNFSCKPLEEAEKKRQEAEQEMESEKKTNQEGPELKRLGFVRIAAIQTLICLSNLYNYAKKNSGPLRSTVGTVEGAVTTVVGPVYRKFKNVPDDLLVFLDKKVDEGTQEFDKHAPPVAKKAVSRAQSLIQIASYKVHELVQQASVGGPRAALHYAARESKHIIVIQFVKVWMKANQFPVIHSVANMAVPTAAHWSEKYNHVIKNMTQKGYPVFGYLPLVPIDEIAKAYKKENATTDKSDSSDSD